MSAVYLLPAEVDIPVRQKVADGTVPTEVRVVGVRAGVAGRPVVIITETSTNLLRQVNSEFIRYLLFGLPVILVLAAGIVWLVVGRALQPVERIRRAVTEISSADLSQRVPEPSTSDEIGNLARTMNDMLARLDHSARKQRRFVADASHELRSPLAAIRTTLEVGLAHPDQAPWPTIADRAARQSIRLEELIQQLLFLARADEHVSSANQQKIGVAALLKELIAAPASRQLDLHIDAGPGILTLGDRDQIGRVFQNLLDNATRFARTRILIKVRTDPDTVIVEIIDDGTGIPPNERGRVFDRFVRLDGSRERSTGNAGLGLAIAREIVVAHHGRIVIGDAPDRGTRVVVTLPRG